MINDFPIAAIQRRNSDQPFDPAHIPGLYSWLAAFDPLADGSIPADGTKISNWIDKSTNNRDGINGVLSQQPIIKLAIQNGLPVIRFDNTNSQYLSTSVSAISPTGFTMFMAHKTRILGAGPETVMSFGNGASDGIAFIPDSTANLILYGGVAIADLSNYASSTDFKVVCIRYSSSGPFTKGYVNNLDGGNTDPAIPPNFPVNSVWYGTSNSSAGFANVDLGECIIYNRALTDQEVSTANTGLMTRWGV